MALGTCHGKKIAMKHGISQDEIHGLQATNVMTISNKGTSFIVLYFFCAFLLKD